MTTNQNDKIVISRDDLAWLMDNIDLRAINLDNGRLAQIVAATEPSSASTPPATVGVIQRGYESGPVLAVTADAATAETWAGIYNMDRDGDRAIVTTYEVVGL